MSESKSWSELVKIALKTQSEMLFDLHKRVIQLEKQRNENTETNTRGLEIIQGITGAQYTPQVFEGPRGVPRKADIDRAEQQRHDAQVHAE